MDPPLGSMGCRAIYINVRTGLDPGVFSMIYGSTLAAGRKKLHGLTPVLLFPITRLPLS